jgi:hypothetical protein
MEIDRRLAALFRRVNITNRSHSAYLYQASENASSSIGTARVVAQIFSERFFVAVRIFETGPDRYLRHSKGSVLIIMRLRGPAASYFGCRVLLKNCGSRIVGMLPTVALP